MTIQFSNGHMLNVEDTGLTYEIQVAEQFVAPVGRCYLLENQQVVTSIVITREVTVHPGTYVLNF